MKGQDNYYRTKYIFFQLFLSFRVEKWEKKWLQMEKIFFQIEQFFSNLENDFFLIFISVTLKRSNEIPNQSNLLGLRKDRK